MRSVGCVVRQTLSKCSLYTFFLILHSTGLRYSAATLMQPVVSCTPDLRCWDEYDKLFVVADYYLIVGVVKLFDVHVLRFARYAIVHDPLLISCKRID